MQSSLRERVVQRAREAAQTTPSWCDRDCRCCMELMRHKFDQPDYDVHVSAFDAYLARTNRDRFKDSYHVKGAGVQVITIEGEEIHADHTDAEIDLFIEAERRRDGRPW